MLSQRGFTLIELMVAMALSLVVGAAALTFMIITFQQQNAISSRTAASRQAEQGLEQLVRDLREAMSSPNVTVATASNLTTITFDIPTSGNDTVGQPVTWSCPSTGASALNIGTCTRNLNGTSRPEILGVQSMALSLSSTGTPAVLTATNPAYLNVTLTVQVGSYADSQITPTKILAGADGTTTTPSTNPVVIQAGVDLRNFT